MKEHIGKKCYIKLGTFRGMVGTIQSEIAADQYLVKLQNGKVIPKKIKHIFLFGEVQSNDNNKKK